LVTEQTFFDAGSIYLTFEAMKEVNRPEGNESWEFYDSSKQIAWKTGTSYGNKDAWAIGVTQDYVVGVWVGNADGEGRPNVTGVSSAAPILFDVFDILPNAKWFVAPFDAFTETVVCAESGFLASSFCPTEKIQIPAKENGVRVCAYHKQIHLESTKKFRVNSSCSALTEASPASWFVLPPLMEFYYKKSNPNYKSLPPFRKDCKPTLNPQMQFIYPNQGSIITLTKNFEGEVNELVIKLAHTKPETKVFWYLDDTFLKQTIDFHEVGIIPTPGKHKILVVDALGNEEAITITIE